jgi:hypothetical protein
MSKEFEQMMKEVDSIHKVWHALTKHLAKWYYALNLGWKNDLTPSKRKYKEVDFSKVKGYQAMKRMDLFIRAHPEIIEVSCDDHHFSSSSLYLIPHETKKKFMGTSVLYISQNAPEQNVFFLYPSHLDGLIEELQKIQKRERKKREITK